MTEIESHLAIVRRQAAAMCRGTGGYVEIDDLVAIGTEALLRAAGRYDASRGVSFASFAYLRVRGAMVEGLGLFGPMSRGWVRRRGDRPGREVPAMSAFDEQLLGAAMSGREVEQQLASAIDAARLAPTLAQALESLDERDRQIIARHYIAGDTLREIGRDMGRSRSWACRIHARALDRLRAALRSGGRTDGCKRRAR